MWKSMLIGGALSTMALAQNSPPQLELANLREDVRGLTQRLGELALRVEQLERENGELRRRAGQAYVTAGQLNEAVAELNRAIKSAVASGKSETLAQVSAGMEKLGRETNAALESLAKAQAARPLAAPAFSENYPKQGVSYTVQKGDSLAGIAKKTGAKQQDIVNANKLSDPDRLVVGQNLFIPGGK